MTPAVIAWRLMRGLIAVGFPGRGDHVIERSTHGKSGSTRGCTVKSVVR